MATPKLEHKYTTNKQRKRTQGKTVSADIEAATKPSKRKARSGSLVQQGEASLSYPLTICAVCTRSPNFFANQGEIKWERKPMKWMKNRHHVDMELYSSLKIQIWLLTIESTP